MKAIIYARVSTEMQEEGRSLEFQIRKCEDFCKYNNYTVKEVIQDVESGGNDNREGFLRLQKEIKKKSFDVLVVYESSRISRITLTMLNFVLELQKSDIKFISISQSEINTTTPTGMLFFQIFAVLADYERKQISMRVKSNKWARAKAGIWQGGNVPIGYKKMGKEIVIDEETKEDVIGIFNTYLATKSLKETAKILGKNISSIKWILQNEFYIGNLMYGRKQNDINTGIVKVNKEIKIFKGNHPALIDEDIFREAQQQMLFKQRYTRIEDKYLFTGLIECTCGGKLYTNAPNYRCEKCKKAITRNKAEKFIINKLLHLKELEFLNSKPNLEKYENDKKSCETQINKLYKEREKYISLYTKDLISEEELEKRLNEIKTKMEFFEKSLEDINRIIESKTLKSNEIDNVKILKEVLDNIDETDRYDLFKMFRMLIKVIKIKKYQPLEVLILLR
jgi:hypothetical protein